MCPPARERDVERGSEWLGAGTHVGMVHLMQAGLHTGSQASPSPHQTGAAPASEARARPAPAVCTLSRPRTRQYICRRIPAHEDAQRAVPLRQQCGCCGILRCTGTLRRLDAHFVSSCLESLENRGDAYAQQVWCVCVGGRGEDTGTQRSKWLRPWNGRRESSRMPSPGTTLAWTGSSRCSQPPPPPATLPTRCRCSWSVAS